MVKLKNNLAKLFVLGVLATFVGHFVNLYLVRPYVDPNYSSLAEILSLILINLALVPAIVLFAVGLFKSAHARKYVFIALNVLALLVLAYDVFYFSYPLIPKTYTNQNPCLASMSQGNSSSQGDSIPHGNPPEICTGT